MITRKKGKRLLLQAAAIGTGALLASCSNDVVGTEGDAATDSPQLDESSHGIQPSDGGRDGFLGRSADGAGIGPVDGGDEFHGKTADAAGIAPADAGDEFHGKTFDAAGIGPADGGAEE